MVLVSTSSPVCPLDRYFFEDLASRVEPFVPEMDGPSIINFFQNEVNLPTCGPDVPQDDPRCDKVPNSYPPGFTPENSVSGFEAFSYSRDLYLNGGLASQTNQAGIANGLVAAFLGGDATFHTIPPLHYIVFKTCHDGDTCTIKEMQDISCRLSVVETSVRISGIDAPEVGYYPSGNGSGWVNSKLVENVDKLRREWLGSIELSKSVMSDINKLIAINVDYTGRLAGLIRNDLNRWNGSENVPRRIEESMINWVWEGKGDKTPPILCGTWQPFDVFGRRLGSFYQVYPSFLESYIGLRLPELMANEGMATYEQYLKKIAPIIARLRNVQNDKAQELVARLEVTKPDEDARNPAVIFSGRQSLAMADAFHQFVEQHGEHYASDDQVLQIITGTVYAYVKYRNQDGDAYEAAGNLAHQNNFGFWNEPTFKTLYDINAMDARYSPPHCP